jgi:hypothetical protein
MQESLSALASLQRTTVECNASPAETETLTSAVRVLGAIDDRIRKSRAQRVRLRRTGRDGRSNWLELSPIHDATRPDDNDEGPMLLYSDPMNLPTWVPDRLERPLTGLGAQLDEARKLHGADIERAVLMFTVWARLVLISLAPILASATFGTVPGAEGLDAGDLPWGLAVLCCVNEPKPERFPGRRSGSERLAALRRRLPGAEIPVRDDVPASEAGLPGSKKMFCVTVLLPVTLFQRTDR